MQILDRPPFPFDGAWISTANKTMTIHIIEADPEVPANARSLPWIDFNDDEIRAQKPWYIRRGRHVALAVDDFQAAEVHLIAKGVTYTKFVIPGTTRQQMFLYDPDGNGVELIEV